MNFDRLAKPYRFLEYLLFWNRLELERMRALDCLPIEGSVLLIGDGDGRFLVEAVKRYPNLRFDVCEMSTEMLAVSKRRAYKQNFSTERVAWVQSDFIESFEIDKRYDIVLTQFVMDCYTADKQRVLACKIRSILAEKGLWVCTDFKSLGDRSPFIDRMLHVLMYAFFRYVTGIEADRLVPICDAAAMAGFDLDRSLRSLDRRLETLVFKPKRTLNEL